MQGGTVGIALSHVAFLENLVVADIANDGEERLRTAGPYNANIGPPSPVPIAP